MPSANTPTAPTSARLQQLQGYVVTAEQMSQIEARIFAAGMPVAALMEKVAGLITQRIRALYPTASRIGVLVGPGHNGGDALVVARELYLSGCEVMLYQPFIKLKELTASHAQYAASLGIPRTEQLGDLRSCDLLVDGLFGFGLMRSLEGEIADAIHVLNQGSPPIVSIDLPSGIHTDTGATLGIALHAAHTLCLGLWKRAFLQDQALEAIGRAELIDFGIPLSDIDAVLGALPLRRITPTWTLSTLPLDRSPVTHKYKQGHLLLVCGSRQYMGASVLAGLAARASGVGMLSIAVPDSLKTVLIGQLPDALTIGCSEDETGAIAALPDHVDLTKYDALACGPGLTRRAKPVVQQLIQSDRPLLLDADGLNILSELDPIATLRQRQAPTVLTPHLGEFKRLFPDLVSNDRIATVQAAAAQSGAIVLLKGARTAIASPQGQTWLNPDSTPALARGGTGDVLTGLTAGLMAQAIQHQQAIDAIVASAAWWHAQAGVFAVQERTELGVDASTLIQHLIPALQAQISTVP